ncbi:hypothetical protein DFJ73DRAFT_761875 [Zopfochytrium polystomum]|nr:hypothetical protein DFJ73DRAFT_761875 [Zopfochytrium polystomum]
MAPPPPPPPTSRPFVASDDDPGRTTTLGGFDDDTFASGSSATTTIDRFLHARFRPVSPARNHTHNHSLDDRTHPPADSPNNLLAPPPAAAAYGGHHRSISPAGTLFSITSPDGAHGPAPLNGSAPPPPPAAATPAPRTPETLFGFDDNFGSGALMAIRWLNIHESGQPSSSAAESAASSSSRSSLNARKEPAALDDMKAGSTIDRSWTSTKNRLFPSFIDPSRSATPKSNADETPFYGTDDKSNLLPVAVPLAAGEAKPSSEHFPALQTAERVSAGAVDEESRRQDARRRRRRMGVPLVAAACCLLFFVLAVGAFLLTRSGLLPMPGANPSTTGQHDTTAMTAITSATSGGRPQSAPTVAVGATSAAPQSGDLNAAAAVPSSGTSLRLPTPGTWPPQPRTRLRESRHPSRPQQLRPPATSQAASTPAAVTVTVTVSNTQSVTVTFTLRGAPSGSSALAVIAAGGAPAPVFVAPGSVLDATTSIDIALIRLETNALGSFVVGTDPSQWWTV